MVRSCPGIDSKRPVSLIVLSKITGELYFPKLWFAIG